MNKFNFQPKMQNILQIKHFLKPIHYYNFGNKTLIEINGQTQRTFTI